MGRFELMTSRLNHEAIIESMYDSLVVVAHNQVESAVLESLIRKHETIYELRYGKPYRGKREIHDAQPTAIRIRLEQPFNKD